MEREGGALDVVDFEAGGGDGAHVAAGVEDGGFEGGGLDLIQMGWS